MEMAVQSLMVGVVTFRWHDGLGGHPTASAMSFATCPAPPRGL